MDESFYEKVIAHTAVHGVVLDLARLEGQYASCAPEQKEEMSARVQTAIHDVVTQACRVGLRQGYIDGLKQAYQLCLDAGACDKVDDIQERVESILEDPETISHYVHTSAFR